jgi:hypothetical protein
MRKSQSRFGLVLAAAMFSGFVTFFAAPSTALAAQIGQPAPSRVSVSAGNCAGPFWGVYEQDVCVLVNTGPKKNHTQLVYSVTVDKPLGYLGIMEAWAGNVWYAQTSNPSQMSVTWQVDRWISSGSGVCGSLQPYYPGDSREVTCITISA